MTKHVRSARKSVTITVDRHRWRGLQFKAKLMNKVFGCKATPELLLQDMVNRILGTPS